MCDTTNNSSEDIPPGTSRIYTVDDILMAERPDNDSMSSNADSHTHTVDSTSWSLASGRFVNIEMVYNNNAL